ncbi:MAG TPA: hypothetical protein VGH28_24465 [Polyangiaceae bacterium]|jgi:hypothetical protein
MKLVLGAAVLALATTVVAPARAETPVVIEYSAPPECASDEAFEALVRSELAPHVRAWRFVVTIRHDDSGADWLATIGMSTATRELRAPTCDDVVAAAALVIATAAPEGPPVTSPPPAPAPPPPPVAIASVRQPDRVAPAPQTSEPAWRVGARAQEWTNGAWLHALGGGLTASVEPTWGRYRMMFELGADVLESDFLSVEPGTTPAPHALTWGVLDFQACPLDVALGSTGLSILGCTRLAAAVDHDTSGGTSGAFFVGAGGRLRWQTPIKLFLELHGNGIYGTQSAPLYGSPAWLDIGASVGLRL